MKVSGEEKVTFGLIHDADRQKAENVTMKDFIRCF